MQKRAIVYICWGQPFIDEAAVSSRSAAFLGIDRILIIPESSRVFVRPNSPFERILTYPFSLAGLMAKSEMVFILPDEYDSFLFLDTDTHVLMDISFGFERAETFGIAAVMAPDYSLDHFWQFGQVLEQMGHPRTDTMQYNTGAIFFSRRDDVWAVLKEWFNLCKVVGTQTMYINDQPFFTLAMERRGFNPYTLSRAYNYRNLGEPICGPVRIWHSHHTPPADVNTLGDGESPRAYRNSLKTS